MNGFSVKTTMVITGFAMAIAGIIQAALGPNLAMLAENTGSSLAAIGSVFSALFFGGIITQALGGPLNDQYGQGPLIMSGFVLIALGCVGMAISQSLVLLMLSATIAGMGRGTVALSFHLLIAKLFDEQRAVAALNLVSVFFGVGAISGPFIAGLAMHYWDNGLVIFWLCALAALVLLPFSFRLDDQSHQSIQRTASTSQTPLVWNLLQSPILWCLGISLFFYSGTETGVGGWFPVYMQESSSLSAEYGAFIASGFWGTISFGRLLVAFFGARINPRSLLLVCLLGSCCGILMIVLGAGNLVISLIGVIIVGLMLGPVYPTMMAIGNKTFTASPGTATSLLSVANSIGGIILPWSQGSVMEYVGPQSAMVMVLLMCIAMLFAELVRRKVSTTQIQHKMVS